MVMIKGYLRGWSVGGRRMGFLFDDCFRVVVILRRVGKVAWRGAAKRFGIICGLGIDGELNMFRVRFFSGLDRVEGLVEFLCRVGFGKIDNGIYFLVFLLL